MNKIYVQKGIGKRLFDGIATLGKDGLLYYPTNLCPPTEFSSKIEAMKAISKSKTIWPKKKFKIVEIEKEEKIDE